MLLHKKLDTNDIVVVRTIGGEEVTGKLVSIDETTLTIARPIALLLHPQGQVTFSPFMLGLEENGKVTFLLDKLVLQPIRARADLAAQYTKATTGLDVPTTKLVV